MRVTVSFMYLCVCVCVIAWSEYANYYQGLWDCEADKPDELAFQRGDLIYILSKVSIIQRAHTHTHT